MIAMVPTNFAQTKITVLTVSVPQVTREQQLVMPTLHVCQSPSAQSPPVMTSTPHVSNLKELTLVLVLMVLQTAVLISHASVTLSSQ